MTTFMPRIKSVEAEKPATLKLEWKPEVTVAGTGHSDIATLIQNMPVSRVDLTGWIATGGEALASLTNWVAFACVKPIEYNSAVAWDDDGDIAIDAYHLWKLAEEQKPFTSEDAAAWQKAVRMSNSEIADFFNISVSSWNAYKAGAAIPPAIGMACRAAQRDPLLIEAHWRPRKSGRPRKSEQESAT
ncbi:hypothetical protein [Ancylobacter defluvii]|uniref:Uncharacterized protein n=1 Tax=Ancylobacter defluvii TaxID=1282440 RepID=A0A9W6ND93_9HYPH|nr:hypothetical protein [Ancylobacter defluvii]MBS7588272.1 hypothetical protein [Ancylobacter defluvii]GLK86668.1 hypothetical protein GCM10017653_47380 [Ancylobacter defluvii]